jgi:predicted short-subunit dehydrogenase-like oxidoreductase (DUF2520 family)
MRTKKMERKLPVIAFAGGGALANGLAPELRRIGCRIDELAVRRTSEQAEALAKATGAKLLLLKEAKFGAELIWLAVSDGAIAPVARQLARRQRDWHGKIVLHSSGALSSRELEPLRAQGASVASLHPMMSFVMGRRPKLDGVCFAVEGDAAAVKAASALARKLGGKVLHLEAAAKPAYHALGAMLSPLLVSHLEAALGIARQAGIAEKDARELLRPIVAGTIENFLTLGPAGALSGPLVRGDKATVEAHLATLQEPELALYKALTAYAVECLPVKSRAAFRTLLKNAAGK